MKKIGIGVALLAALALAAHAEKEANVVQLNELPAAAQQALVQQAGQGTIERVIKAPVTYEIDMTLEGKKQRLPITEDATRHEGPILRDQEPLGTVVSWSELPQAVQRFVSTTFPQATVDEVRQGSVVYIATVKASDGEGLIRVRQDGRILSNQNATELAEQKRAQEKAMAEHRAKENAMAEHRAKENALTGTQSEEERLKGTH